MIPGPFPDPHGWLSAITATAPVVVMCTVIIVVMLCVTTIVLVRHAEPSQRATAIKALAPMLLALASRLTAWLATWRNL